MFNPKTMKIMELCSNCGQRLSRKAAFCSRCGTPVAKPSERQAQGSKSRVTAIILCLFFGVFGIHRFYLGDKWEGCSMLVIGIAGLFFWLLLITNILWAFNDIFSLCLLSGEEFNAKYNTKQ